MTFFESYLEEMYESKRLLEIVAPQPRQIPGAMLSTGNRRKIKIPGQKLINSMIQTKIANRANKFVTGSV